MIGAAQPWAGGPPRGGRLLDTAGGLIDLATGVPVRLECDDHWPGTAAPMDVAGGACLDAWVTRDGLGRWQRRRVMADAPIPTGARVLDLPEGEVARDGAVGVTRLHDVGEWLVAGPPGAEVGERIVVTRRYGGTSERAIDAVVEPGLYRVGLTATYMPTPTAEVPEGIHIYSGSVYKVQTSSTSWKRYAKRLVIPEKGRPSWQYVGGAPLKHLSPSTLITEEDAARFGLLTGVCACCGRTLTDPESIARGIGPVCARNRGW